MPPPPFLLCSKKKKGRQSRKERVSKQKLLKGCHQGKNIIVLAILEPLEFENVSCRPTLLADNTIQHSMHPIHPPPPPPHIHTHRHIHTHFEIHFARSELGCRTIALTLFKAFLLELVFQPHFLFNFYRKIFTLLYYTNFPNIIVWFFFYCEIFGNMCIVIICHPFVTS